MSDLVFVASPFRALSEEGMKKNQEVAIEFMQKLRVHCGDVGFAPHVYFPEILDEFKEPDRRDGIEAGFKIMRICKRLYAVGPKITEGMAEEIDLAQSLNIPIICVPNPDRFFAHKSTTTEIETETKKRWPFDFIFERLYSWLSSSSS